MSFDDELWKACNSTSVEYIDFIKNHLSNDKKIQKTEYEVNIRIDIKRLDLSE